MLRSPVLTFVATTSLLCAALAACSPSDRVAKGKPDGGTGGNGGAGGNGGSAGADGGVGPSPIDPGKPFSGEHADPSAPPGAKDAFTGPMGTDGQLKIIYPLDGAMLGKNIGGMNIQWSTGSTNKLFRVRVKGDMGEAFLYAGSSACPMNQCRLPVPDDFWKMIGAANAGARFTITVDGVPAPGGAVSSSGASTNFFAPDDIEGAIYYWSPAMKGIYRVAIGSNTPEPFVAPGTAAGGQCSGCHTLSRDGCKIAVNIDHEVEWGIVSARDASQAVVRKGESAAFFAWNQDGSRVLTSMGGKITEHDGTTGAVIKTIPQALIGAPDQFPNHPAWSPDNKWIMFDRMPSGTNSPNQITNCGDLMLMPYNDGMYGMAEVLVPAVPMKDVNTYSDFSPDSKWAVFNTNNSWSATSPQVAFVNSFSQSSSRLRLVSVAGGPPIELAKATVRIGLTDSWPKFSPFAQRSGNLMFIVFSSALPYGWLGNGSHPQLWVAAIDVSKPGDPSYPPFWLPFQLLSEGNHIAYWTKKIPSFTSGTDCP